MTERLFGRFECIEELSRRGKVSTLKCADADGGLVVLKLFEAASERDRVEP